MTDKDNFNMFVFERFEREKHPEAFLFTESESKLLEKVFNCMNIAGIPYSELPTAGTDKETIEALMKDIMSIFESKKISIKKLIAIRKKAMQSYYWSFAPETIKREDNNHLLVTAATGRYKITISTEEKNQIVTLDSTHDFFKAETLQEAAQALNIDSLCQYVSNFELHAIDYVITFLSFYDYQEGKTSKELALQQNDTVFYPVVSTYITNLLRDIGTGAKQPKQHKELDERGKQITIAEYLTSTGYSISFADFSPYASSGFISVGDPNTDKLLLQAQIITARTGQKEIDIPMSEFMEFRNYSKNYRKEAIEKARNACKMLLIAGSDVDIEDPTATITGGWRYVQKCFVSKSDNGRNFIKIVWSDDIFDHIMKYATSGRQIEQLDKNITIIPDNQAPAYNIARKFSRHLRANAGKPNDHRLSVQTLISCVSTWPLYTEDYKSIPKEEQVNYIKFPSQAPDRIIKPFVETLEYLTQKHVIFKSYTFKHKNGKILTDAEVKAAMKDYKAFIELNVEVVFKNEPNYNHLKEKKAKQIEKTTDKKNTKK